jgi:hypothetical protein
MSDAPIAKVLAAELTPKSLRKINREYHVELIADNSTQLVEYQSASLRLQAEVAARGLAQGAESNEYPAAIERDCTAIRGGIERLSGQVSEGFAEVTDALDAGFDALEHLLETMSKQLQQQQRVLEDIAATLRAPKGTKASDCVVRPTNGSAWELRPRGKIATSIGKPLLTFFVPWSRTQLENRITPLGSKSDGYVGSTSMIFPERKGLSTGLNGSARIPAIRTTLKACAI